MEEKMTDNQTQAKENSKVYETKEKKMTGYPTRELENPDVDETREENRTGNQTQANDNLDLKNELSEMEKELDAQEMQFTQLKQGKEQLKNDIARMRKVVNDIDSSAGTYANAFLALQKDASTNREFCRVQDTLFKAELPEDQLQGLNERIVNAVQLKSDYDAKKLKYENALDVYQKAKTNRDEKQREFDECKGLTKTIKDRLNIISNFRASIEEEAKKGNKDCVFFLLNDNDGGLCILIKKLDELFEEKGLTNLLSSDPSPGDCQAEEPGENFEPGTEAQILGRAREEYKNSLMKKWKELDLAEEELKVKEVDMKLAEEEYKSSQTALEELKSNPVNNILKKYKNSENENKIEEVNNA
jgi:hypothetical protein